jgi:uncharacterized protein
VTRNWTILLPPSRGVREGGDASVTWSDTHLAGGKLGTARRRVIAAARTLGRDALVDAIGGEAAVIDARRMLRDIHRAPTMPAVERYAGVVYDHLDVAGLPAAVRIGVHTGTWPRSPACSARWPGVTPFRPTGC